MTETSTLPHRVSGLPIRTLRVEVVQGPDTGKIHVAAEDSVTLGTAPGNDLVLSDETVSRYHLELQRKSDRIVVVDHGSTNGTALGTALVDKASVTPGTVLTIGRSALRVTDGDTVTVPLYDEDRFGLLRGRTPEMRSLMSKIERAAKNDVSVLVLGETGTGKELIAHAIHEASPRAAYPFETVDCAALLPTLVASELFGHEKGAFTGADRQHVGAFERANGGTLFLDEIGELPAALQSALLGALERREFRRVGGQKKIAVNVRVICATNRDLRGEVNAGTFRQDLYFRIGVLLLRVPPLRERTGDIPLLVEHFLREAGHDGPVEEVIAQSTMQALRAHHWPGNVRELRNFVETALAMGEAPRLDDAPGAARGSAEGLASLFTREGRAELCPLSYKDARARVLAEFERFYLEDLMRRVDHNVSHASREAKMNRSYLIEMLKRLGIR